MADYKKPSPDELKKRLTPIQFAVTQQDDTEPPFRNEYWNEKRDGLYVDITTGEPLFTSKEKYDSGCGWPSFTKPLNSSGIVEKQDNKLFSTRTEVRSKIGDSHLGHVFEDGPRDQGGLRYCINSASLKFIPVEDLDKEGYREFKKIFGIETESSSKSPQKAKTETLTLAGGCFWGVEELMRVEPGVLKTEVGYAGGETENPTYETVKLGRTGHAEALEIEFDPSQTSVEKLLTFFFKMHDPTTPNQQGNDKGSQYRSVIFYRDENQKQIAEKIIERVNKSGVWKKSVVTELVPFEKFYSAEGYHQDYLQKNPGGYTCHYVRKVDF